MTACWVCGRKQPEVSEDGDERQEFMSHAARQRQKIDECSSEIESSSTRVKSEDKENKGGALLRNNDIVWIESTVGERIE